MAHIDMALLLGLTWRWDINLSTHLTVSDEGTIQPKVAQHGESFSIGKISVISPQNLPDIDGSKGTLLNLVNSAISFCEMQVFDTQRDKNTTFY